MAVLVLAVALLASGQSECGDYPCAQNPACANNSGCLGACVCRAGACVPG